MEMSIGYFKCYRENLVFRGSTDFDHMIFAFIVFNLLKHCAYLEVSTTYLPTIAPFSISS